MTPPLKILFLVLFEYFILLNKKRRLKLIYRLRLQQSFKSNVCFKIGSINAVFHIIEVTERYNESLMTQTQVCNYHIRIWIDMVMETELSKVSLVLMFPERELSHSTGIEEITRGVQTSMANRCIMWTREEDPSRASDAK